MNPYMTSMDALKQDYPSMKGEEFYSNGGMFGNAGTNYYSHLPANSSNAMNFDDSIGSFPPADQNMNYYQEYCRLFIANVVLTTQMKELINEKNELMAKLSGLEMRKSMYKQESQESHSPKEKKTPRHRRPNKELEKPFQCPVGGCQKPYAGEPALYQHIRLKHPDVTKDPDWKMKVVQKGEESERS